MSSPELRAGDADRERAVERLRAAAAEGRLGADELEQRLESALAARTHGELERLVSDLPRPTPPAPPLRPRRAHAELQAFIGTSVLLVAIWALTGAGYFWPVWPILGWGLCLAGPACGMGPRRRIHGAPR